MKIYKVAQNNSFGIQELSYMEDPNEIERELNNNSVAYNKVNLNGNIVFVVSLNNTKYVVDPDGRTDELSTWLWTLDDRRLTEYSSITNFNENFWKYANIAELYHGTHKEYVDSIKTNGLLLRNDSRGISNRSTGNAIFTTTEPLRTDSYGGYLVIIDVNKMRADNFMPEVGKEEPVHEAEMRHNIAEKLGEEDFIADGSLSLENEGIWGDTIVIYENIPAKYLRIEKK